MNKLDDAATVVYAAGLHDALLRSTRTTQGVTFSTFLSRAKANYARCSCPSCLQLVEEAAQIFSHALLSEVRPVLPFEKDCADIVGQLAGEIEGAN